jgi:hypothetical protein
VGDTYNYYITLESLCNLVNEYVIFKNIDSQEGKVLLEVSTHNRTYDGTPSLSLECIAHPLQISTDPTRCLIKAEPWINQSVNAFSSTPRPDDTTIPVTSTVKNFVNYSRRFNDPVLLLYKAIDEKSLVYNNIDVNNFKNILQDIRKEIVYSLKKADKSFYVLEDNDKIPYANCEGLKGGQLGFNILKFMGKNAEDVYNTISYLGIGRNNNSYLKNISLSATKLEIIKALNDELSFKPLNDNDNKWGSYLYDNYSAQIINVTSQIARKNLADLNSLKPYFIDNNLSKGNISNIYVDIDYLHFLLTSPGLEYRDASGKHTINLVDFFKNTGDITDYIKYYPDFMKQPNKLYHQYYKQFPNPYFKE